MAEVFGRIGNEEVELNNAATEATLKMLLQATVAAANGSRDELNRIASLAARTGLDSESIERSNAAVRGTIPQMNLLGKASYFLGATFGAVEQTLKNVWKTGEILTSGNAQASQVLTSLTTLLPGPIGEVAKGLSLLARFQEDLLGSYRTLTQAGVNFGGSLTDLRLAASQTYMTMDQFVAFVKANSDSLSRLGSTVDEGIKSFEVVSNEFNQSNIGKHLRDLGFTSDQMNEHLVKFMALQGRAGVQDSKRMQEVQVATASYMTELDALTKLTGANKEALEAERKKAELNAAYQSKLLSLAPAEQAKLKAAYDKAAASGVKGATDLVMSTALGLVPVTKEAQALSGTLPKAAEGFVGMTKSAMQTGSTMRDVNKQYAGAVQGAIEGTKGMERTIGALSMSGGAYGEVLNSGLALSNKARQQEQDSVEKYMAAYDKATTTQTVQNASQAAAAAETEKKLNELGQAILERVMPAFQNLLSIFNPMIQTTADILTKFVKIPGALETLIVGFGLLTAATVAYKMHLAIKAAKAITRGTDADPMIVRVQGPGGLGGGGPGGGPRGPGGGGGRPGLGGRLIGGLKGGLGGIAGGLLLGAASDVAKEKGMEKTGAGFDIASSAANWAGTGAMIGSIVPGLGTVAGGAIGGIAGAGYGLYQNWEKLFGKSEEKSKESADQTSPAKEFSASPELKDLARIMNERPSQGVPGIGTPLIPPLSASIPPIFLDDLKKFKEEIVKLKKSETSDLGKEEDSVSKKEVDFKTIVMGKVESLADQLQRLNKQTEQLVAVMKETAENTRRNVDATKAITGDLFV